MPTNIPEGALCKDCANLESCPADPEDSPFEYECEDFVLSESSPLYKGKKKGGAKASKAGAKSKKAGKKKKTEDVNEEVAGAEDTKESEFENAEGSELPEDAENVSLGEEESEEIFGEIEDEKEVKGEETECLEFTEETEEELPSKLNHATIGDESSEGDSEEEHTLEEAKSLHGEEDFLKVIERAMKMAHTVGFELVCTLSVKK